MQTRRDQLHAYRFLTKRALAALVSGEPNAVEPPMRRLSLTTISGIMIAVLVGVGFAVFGLIRPSAGESWKDAGTVIIERETGDSFVYRNDMLIPVRNFSSGVLAVAGQGTSAAKTVLVDRDEIADTPRGPRIGIDGIPASFPPAGDIVNSPWVVCSRQTPTSPTTLTARVSLTIGDSLATTRLPDGDAVLVTTPADPTTSYLLWGGVRYKIASPAITSALRLDDATALVVGTAFLQSLDAGTTLDTPTIGGLGDPGPRIDGQQTTVGQLLRADGTDDYSVVLSDGVQTVNALEATLLKTVRAAPELLAPSTAIVNAEKSPRGGQELLDTAFANLPADLPRVDSRAGDLGDVCAVFTDDTSRPPSFAVVPGKLPDFPVGDVVETSRSAGGLADSVYVSPGHAAIVRSGDNSPTVFTVAEPGKKYAFATPEVRAAFGYGDLVPATMPGQLLPLVPTGPALDPTAALTPDGG